MFKKENLKEYLNNLEIDKQEYCVIAGGSLLMHGIKEGTEDIDLYVSEKGFNQLKEKYSVIKSNKPYDNLYQVNDDLEVILTDIKRKNIYYVEEIPCISIFEEYQWKKEKNRDKDKEIIRQLEKLINKTSQYYKCTEEELTEQQIEEYVQNSNK